MRKFAVLFLTLLLCIFAIPAIAEEDEGGANELFGEDSIWIAISPMESHPMFVDRPYAVIPTIPGYPIRVAVYSNPYKYLTTDEDGDAIWDEIYDPYAPNFSVSSLNDFTKEQITIRVPNANNPESPASSGASYETLHTENDYKWQYVFYVRDLDDLDANVERLFFVADNGVNYYQGSGVVKVTATSQIGGGGGKPDNTGSSGKPDNTGSSNSDKKGGGSGSSGSGRGR